MLERPDSLNDTIVACATPPGEGAIAVVRLAGPRAREVAQALSPGRAAVRSHQLVYTHLEDGAGNLLDDGMVVEMHAPHSYTGDDVVELHLHGSRAVVQSVIEACMRRGARLARPGEYTLRAFLNGRMDLTRAEAVADLIAARTDTQRLVAANHLRGELSQALTSLSERLEGVLADWRAAVDFPEQLPDADWRESHLKVIGECNCKIQSMLSNSRAQLRSGLKVVLCGATNVGKSTLLNAWVGETRVLVDGSPGTTRDPVEVELFDGPIRWSICDTAGIRKNASGLEARGIALALERIRRADLAVWLVGGGDSVWPSGELTGLAKVAVGAKADVTSPEERRRVENEAGLRGLGFLGWVSARSGEGIKETRAAITARLSPAIPEGVPVLVRQRHIEALAHAGQAIAQVELAARQGAPLDLMAVDLEEACRAVGRVLGRDVDQSVLDRIFSEFCLGK